MKKIWKIFVGVIFLAVCSGCGIKKEQKKTIEDTKEKIYRECEMLAEGYRNIYENAVKENALYELSTIQKSMDYFGKYGYAVIDSYNQLDMVQSIKVDDFLKKAEKEKNGKTTIFQVSACKHWLSGLLKCSVCGATLSYTGNNKCPYFQCWKYAKGFHKTSVALSVKKAEEAVISYFDQILDGAEFTYVCKKKKTDHSLQIEPDGSLP